MDIKKLFSKHMKRLQFEAALKSALIGLVAGFAAAFVFAVVDTFFGFKLLYVDFIILAAVTALVALPVYFFKLRPDEKTVARRLDLTGLEERVITMNELKDDDSYMAKRQREDALSVINSLSAAVLSIAVSVPLIVAVAVSGVLAAGATVSSMTIKTPVAQLIIDATTPYNEKYVTATYEVEGEGYITGDVFQELLKGDDAQEVTAYAETGWVFAGWSDGLTTPSRTDRDIDEDIEVYAIFMEVEESLDGDPDADPSTDPNAPAEDDGASPSPSEGEGQPGESGGDGVPTPPQDGEDGDGDGRGDPTQNPGASGGRSEAKNQIIDGQTYYGDRYGDAVNKATEDLNNGDGDYSDGDPDLINGYLKGLGGN